VNAPVADDAVTPVPRVPAWRRLTASGLRLAALCAAAYALPADDAESTDAQAAGTGRHAFLDALAVAWMQNRKPLDGDAPIGLDARLDALATVPADAPHRATCESIDVAELLAMTGADVGTVEVGVQLDWDPWADDGGEHVSAAQHRAYRTDPSRIYGTADWIVTDPSGAVTVIDFKGSERNEPAREHAQLAFYALAVARSRGLATIGVALVYVHEDGALYADRAHLDEWDLSAHAAKLLDTWVRVTAARAEVDAGRPVGTATGGHCARCPAMRVCPAQVTLVRALASEVAAGGAVEDIAGGLARLSDADAGRAWDRLQQAEAALKTIRASLTARAGLRGLPLPDGSHLTPVDTTRRTVDVERALPVLRARFGDQADAAVERSLAIGDVERLARQLAPGKGQKRAVEAVVAELAAAGAVRESRFVQLRVRKARNADEAADA